MNVYECIADHDVALIDYGTYKPGDKLETENFVFNSNFKLVSSDTVQAQEQPVEQPAIQAVEVTQPTADVPVTPPPAVSEPLPAPPQQPVTEGQN